MDVKLSRRLLIAEAVVLALPVTALLVLGVTGATFSLGEPKPASLGHHY